MISNIIQSEVCHIQLEDLQTFPGSDDEVIRVYIVRHGESALNVMQDGIKYVQGQSPSVALTDKGSKQADELAKQMAPRMKDLKLRLVTSTAKRAIDTAKPLADRLKQVPSAHAEFLELGSGKWEGVSKEDPEYLAEYNKYKRLSANQKFSAPKVSTGESYSQVALRALDGLSRVLSQTDNDETVFLFSHHMLMNAVVLSLTNTELSTDPQSPLPECNIDNGDIILIEIPRGASAEQGHIKSVIHSGLKDI